MEGSLSLDLVCYSLMKGGASHCGGGNIFFRVERRVLLNPAVCRGARLVSSPTVWVGLRRLRAKAKSGEGEA